MFSKDYCRLLKYCVCSLMDMTVLQIVLELFYCRILYVNISFNMIQFTLFSYYKQFGVTDYADLTACRTNLFAFHSSEDCVTRPKTSLCTAAPLPSKFDGTRRMNTGYRKISLRQHLVFFCSFFRACRKTGCSCMLPQKKKKSGVTLLHMQPSLSVFSSAALLARRNGHTRH